VRALIAEDETHLAQQLSAALADAGYAVDCAGDGERAEFLGQTESYDVVVLDLGLPKLDGLTVLTRWRAAGLTVPVLILTARGSWYEKVQGIDAGADDYLSKPFRMEELLARLRGLIRRARQMPSSEIHAGTIAVDSRTGRVTVNGEPIRLTALEFRVLSYLMHHRGRAVPQTELAEHIYPIDEDRDSNTIEVFIARLRRKLGPGAIDTVRGFGYRIGTPENPR
jgi:two-component system OmpR family response regulator